MEKKGVIIAKMLSAEVKKRLIYPMFKTHFKVAISGGRGKKEKRVEMWGGTIHVCNVPVGYAADENTEGYTWSRKH